MAITRSRSPRNKFEARLYGDLSKRKASFKYESEKILYTYSGHYTPDFVVETRQGKVYIEAKGYFRPEDKRKIVAVKKCNPTLDIRIVFYSHNKTSIRWATKYGIPYAIGEIPKDWTR